MLGPIASTITPRTAGLLAQATTAPADALPLSPVVILILCVVAGVGTVMLLPGRREAPLRKVGGVILLAAGLIFAALLLRWTAGSARGGMGVYFWIFAVLAIAGAVRVITHPKPVYSALYFVLTVFATAGLFLLLQAEFIAAALVLIYAGAILVTYVFVIMLAAEAAPATGAAADAPLAGMAEHDAVSREPLLASAVGFALMAVLLFVIFDRAQLGPAAVPRPIPVSAAPDAAEPTDASVASEPVVAGSTQMLGAFLFTRHMVSLELAGLILTIAMVGAIMIARKRVIVVEDSLVELKPEVITGPATPVDDNPHSIPVEGTRNPRQKAYPET